MVLLSNEQVCMFTLQILICAIYTVIGCLRFKRMNSRGVMNSMQNTGFYLITRYFSGGAGRRQFGVWTNQWQIWAWF